MILLSYDLEEFDLPREHGVDIPVEDQVKVSLYGANAILDCLLKQQVKATFFCTANFALHAPVIIERIRREGHELASHGYNHWHFETSDLLKSKETLECMMGSKVCGYRQARMMPVSEKAIADAGYTYNSSLNPTFIPGRYINLNVPRTPFIKDGIIQMPSSVTPIVRFPLFWLSAHHLPCRLYYRLCSYTHRNDDYLALYFHPWEFYPLCNLTNYKIPCYISRRSGERMLKILDGLISYLKKQKVEFGTFSDYLLKMNK